MSSLLLDTHAVIWLLDDDRRLGPIARSQIADDDTDVLVSVASVWEMAIKRNLGRLSVPDNFWEMAVASGVRFINIEQADAQLAGSLPLHHRDPFDRMLIGQAINRGLRLVTNDRQFLAYECLRMRADE